MHKFLMIFCVCFICLLWDCSDTEQGFCTFTGTVADFEIKCSRAIESFFEENNSGKPVTRFFDDSRGGKKLSLEKINDKVLKGNSSGYVKLKITVNYEDKSSSQITVN